MFNAYVLYRARNPEQCKSLLEFTRRVVRMWSGKQHGVLEAETDQADQAHNPRAPYNMDPESRLDGNMARHRLEKLMPTAKKTRPTRRCRVCVRSGLRSETRMWCVSCRVALHAGKCFTAYHTQK